MNQLADYKTLDYLNLDIKNPENFSRNRKTTLENNRLICLFKENYNHKIHSNTNNQNYEQLNTIVDLLCNLSENLKLKLEKQNKSVESPKPLNTGENLIYLKDFLEDIFRNIKEENKSQTTSIKHIELEIIKTNKLLETILYGKQRS